MEAPPGPLLVLAGAGSGKTRVLTHRVAHLIGRGAPASSVLLMTFTTAAAAQMVRRTATLLGGEPAARDGPADPAPADLVGAGPLAGMWAGTFHHVALRLLQRHGARLHLPAGFTVLDQRDAADLLRACLRDAGLLQRGAAQRVRPEAVLRLLSLSVNREETLEGVLRRRAHGLLPLLPVLGGVCDDYARRKLRLSALDFDDLLLFLRLLLFDHADVRAAVQGQFRHVLVDEYQDTSPLQAALCDQLASGHGSLTAVGDDAQAIYGFRGAEVDGVVSFARRWPGARVLALRDNYRSSAQIVALANRVLGRHARPALPRLPMRAVRGLIGTDPPAICALPDAVAQAAFVARRARELIAAGLPAGEIAVLYRNHAHAMEVQVELLRQHLPYRLNSGPRLMQQAHVKDALSYLRLIDQPGDVLAWRRVLAQQAGVGPRLSQSLIAELERGATLAALIPRAPRPARSGLTRLGDLLAELHAARLSADPRQRTPAALLGVVLRQHYAEHARRVFPDAEERLAELRTLGAQLGGASLSEALSELALSAPGTPTEIADPAARSPDRVVLSTVHRAKGLEWAVVFVLWLCEGRFPSALALSQGDSAEERRLFYVAATRARDQLYLCHPLRGTEGALRPSRFLTELEGEDPPFRREPAPGLL